MSLKSRKQLSIIIVYLILLIIAIPWYWPKDSVLMIFGFPAWVFVAILISLITSVFTAYLLLSSPWDTDINPDE